jgi:hypothetical protein
MTDTALPPIGEVLDGLAVSCFNFTRHPRVRIGERDEIPGLVRALVFERDGRRCLWCGSAERLTLDHLVPWSAGGSDHSSNLRTLCWPCNEERSNFVMPLDRTQPMLPVAKICLPCHYDGFNRYRDDDDALHSPPTEDFVLVFCGRCHLTSWTYRGVEL